MPVFLRAKRVVIAGDPKQLPPSRFFESAIAVSEDDDIETDQGERVFKLDGKALRIRKTILFKDMDGRELCKIQEKMLHVRDSMEIEGPDGKRLPLIIMQYVGGGGKVLFQAIDETYRWRRRVGDLYFGRRMTEPL